MAEMASAWLGGGGGRVCVARRVKNIRSLVFLPLRAAALRATVQNALQSHFVKRTSCLHIVLGHYKQKKGPKALFSCVYGGPDAIRTHDPCLRRAVLYPAELRIHTLILACGRTIGDFGLIYQCFLQKRADCIFIYIFSDKAFPDAPCED